MNLGQKKHNKVVLGMFFLAFTSIWCALSIYSYIISFKTDENSESDKKTILESIDQTKREMEASTKDSNRYFDPVMDYRKIFDKYLLRYNMTTSLNGTHNDSQSTTDVVLAHSDGYLSLMADLTDIEENYEKMFGLADRVMKEGRDFVYIMPPVKDGELDHSYKDVYIDHSSEVRDLVKHRCTDDRIPVITVGDHVESLADNEDVLFFRGDHHWLPQTAMFACGLLADWMNERGYSIDVSKFDMKNYDIQYSPTAFIGSLGRKVSTIYADNERMPILIPKYESNLTVFISGTDTESIGTIDETLFDYSQLECSSKYSQRQYRFYGYGDQGIIKIHNNLLNDGKRVLIIKESYADFMIPYLSNVAEYVSAIDPRHYEDSIISYIEEYDPDTIVFVYGTSVFVDHSDVKTRGFEFE